MEILRNPFILASLFFSIAGFYLDLSRKINNFLKNFLYLVSLLLLGPLFFPNMEAASVNYASGFLYLGIILAHISTLYIKKNDFSFFYTNLLTIQMVILFRNNNILIDLVIISLMSFSFIFSFLRSKKLKEDISILKSIVGYFFLTIILFLFIFFFLLGSKSLSYLDFSIINPFLMNISLLFLFLFIMVIIIFLPFFGVFKVLIKSRYNILIVSPFIILVFSFLSKYTMVYQSIFEKLGYREQEYFSYISTFGMLIAIFIYSLKCFSSTTHKERSIYGSFLNLVLIFLLLGLSPISGLNGAIDWYLVSVLFSFLGWSILESLSEKNFSQGVEFDILFLSLIGAPMSSLFIEKIKLGKTLASHGLVWEYSVFLILSQVCAFVLAIEFFRKLKELQKTTKKTDIPSYLALLTVLLVIMIPIASTINATYYK